MGLGGLVQSQAQGASQSINRGPGRFLACSLRVPCVDAFVPCVAQILASGPGLGIGWDLGAQCLLGDFSKFPCVGLFFLVPIARFLARVPCVGFVLLRKEVPWVGFYMVDFFY